MARVYLSCSEIHSLDLLPLCQSALEAAGHSYLWDSDLVIEGEVCHEASWGEIKEGGITFPCPPEVLVRLPELIRQREEANERFRQGEEARKRAKAVWERLEGLPDFKRGDQTFKVFVQKYDAPLVGCRMTPDFKESDLSDGVSIEEIGERSKRDPKYFDYWKYIVVPLSDLGREEGFSDQELVAAIIAAADKILGDIEQSRINIQERARKARIEREKREAWWASLSPQEREREREKERERQREKEFWENFFKNDIPRWERDSY